jgi:copper chaperone CopZ
MNKLKNTILAIIIAIITLGTLTQCSTSKPKKIKAQITFGVEGNCEMCKERIENALDVKGVYQAIYDLNNKKIFIVYNAAQFKEVQLHNMIASVGHDTEQVKADDLVYNNLPGCCKYRSDDDF